MTPAAVRVTMGGLAGDRSPARLQTMEVRDRALPDPAGLDDAGFRAVRDDIRSRGEGLVRERGRLHRLRAQIAPRPASP